MQFRAFVLASTLGMTCVLSADCQADPLLSSTRLDHYMVPVWAQGNDADVHTVQEEEHGAPATVRHSVSYRAAYGRRKETLVSQYSATPRADIGLEYDTDPARRLIRKRYSEADGTLVAHSLLQFSPTGDLQRIEIDVYSLKFFFLDPITPEGLLHIDLLAPVGFLPARIVIDLDPISGEGEGFSGRIVSTGHRESMTLQIMRSPAPESLLTVEVRGTTTIGRYLLHYGPNGRLIRNERYNANDLVNSTEYTYPDNETEEPWVSRVEEYLFAGLFPSRTNTTRNVVPAATPGEADE